MSSPLLALAFRRYVFDMKFVVLQFRDEFFVHQSGAAELVYLQEDYEPLKGLAVNRVRFDLFQVYPENPSHPVLPDH